MTVIATDGLNSDIGAAVSFPWKVNYGITVSLANPGTTSDADGDTVNIALAATDSVADPVNYAATGLPAGLSINATTGYITGTIASGAYVASPYAVTLTATDALYNIYRATQTFQWNVSAAGTITVTITNPGTQTNQEGDSVNLTLSATDSASNSVTFDASNLPPGLTLDPTTGLISGTIDPGAHLYSPYTSIVTANDSVNPTAGAQATLQWNVNVSTTPTVSLTNPGTQVNDDGDNVTLNLAGIDSLGNALTYTATGLPPGLAVNSTTGSITGTVNSGDDANNPYNVTVIATDSVVTSVSASQTFVWQAQPAGQVQVVNPGNQNNAPGNQVTLPISGRNPTDHPLAWSASNLPTGLSINAVTGVITGTVSVAALSFTGWRVSVTASDTTNPANSATVQFVWNVLTRTILGPSAVPGNSQYTYSISLPGQAAGQWQVVNPILAQNLATLGATQQSYNAAADMTTFSVAVTFANSAGGGTATIAFTNQASQTIATLDVGVVQVNVGAPAGGNPAAFTAGTVQQNPTDPTGTDPVPGQLFRVKTVWSGWGTDVGLNWNAAVTLLGPAQAISQITVGFIQHIRVAHYSGAYGNGRDLTSPTQGAGSYLDVADMNPGPPPSINANPTLPWYSTQFGSIPANPAILPTATFTAAQPSKTIGSWDNPGLFLPINYQMNAAGNSALQSVSIVCNFTLDVAAQTSSQINNANNFYWGESGGQWAFNGSGNVQTNIPANTASWTGVNAGDTASAGWNGYATPTAEAVSTPIFNVVARRSQFR